ncbi:MAG: hypothetical protein ABI415_10295, partial [Flavitalea sp.]
MKQGSPMKYYIFIIMMLALFACQQPATAPEDPAVPVTPVTITTITKKTFGDTMALNATSSFLLKSFIKANATGYLQMENLKPGQFINKGKLL